MQIKFNIEKADDCETAIAVLTTLRGAMFDETVRVTDETVQDQPDTNVPAQTDPRGGVELDANNTPWIEGVHAGTKTKKTDGTWKKARGVTDEELATAETEARAKLAGTPDPVLPGQSAEPTQTPVEELPPVTIEDLTAVYSQAVEANVVTPEQVSEMYLRHGCMEIGDIATNESARRGVVGELQKMIDDKPAGLPGT